MGCATSIPVSHKRRASSVPDVRIPYMEDSNNLQVLTVKDYDRKSIAQLKRDFQENLDMFLLNNILLCVMFYENYEQEMAKTRSTISIEEQEMSRQMITKHHKQCIMPDTAAELVNHRVRYLRKINNEEEVEESIITLRKFVIYDTIEILKEDEDLDHYTGIDKPTDRAHVLKSSNHGFVKLKHPESQACSDRSNYSVLSSPIYTNGHSGSPSSPNLSEASTSRDSEDYLYTRINEMNDLQQLSQTRTSSNSSGAPINCLRPVKTKNHGDTEDLFIYHRYYDSTEFMRHFKDRVFPGELAKFLGFDEEMIGKATHNSRAIYCDAEHERGLVKYEIVPAVVNPWPGLNFWSARQRNIIRDEWKGIRYVWPTPQMIQDIIKLPAALVPRGFAPKRGTNPDYNLEWEISFPRAEKYMHTRMSHAQMRCYLFLAILHKTYIEPATKNKGLVLDHLRTLMYWECEKNYKDWPENRLGEKMIRLLKTLAESVGKQELKDFFIENKNTLANAPSPLLRYAHEKIHNICERPVGHFIYALRHLTYSGTKFYPMFNFDELYKILTTTESLAMINPMISQAHRTEIENVRTYTEEQKWLQKRRMQHIRRRREFEEQNRLNEPAAPAVETIDLKWTSHASRIDSTKAVMILKFFVKHFLKIAEKSMKYHGATFQALLYLKQSWYLTKVMEDPMIGSGDIFVRELQGKIKELEELYEETFSGEGAQPTTPARNSVNQVQHQLVKNTRVDLNKVSQQFQNGYVNQTERRIPRLE